MSHGRWVMKGPWKHPNGVWYYRGELPKDLWDARDRLEALGVSVGRGKEIRRSLETRMRKEAEQRYRDVATELDARWSNLRRVLAQGPSTLSERNIVALAGERAKRLLTAHQDNPSQTPSPSRIAPELPPEIVDEVAALTAEQQRRMKERLAATLGELERSDRKNLATLLQAWSQDPVMAPVAHAILKPLAQTLTSEHGEELRDLLDQHGVVVDANSGAGLLLTSAEFQAKARSSLKTMAERHDYRQPEWVNGLPDYQPPTATASAHTFGSVIDAEDKRRSLGRDAKALRPKTVSRYKVVCDEFAAFRGKGGSDPTTVTADELEQWKTAQLEAGVVGNRTINMKMGAIKTVIRWGRGMAKAEFAKAATEVAEVSLPDFVPKPSDQSAIHPDEAVIILRAAREESDPKIRWLPWLCAYSGLRISEACQLRTTDFFESEGHWFFEVATSGKRSLKTENARRTIPVHRALIREGFLDYVRGLPPGSLFPRGSAVALHRWFHTLKGIHEGVSPNHGWRHLFKDLCRRYELNDDARHYLAGHSVAGADQGYGRTRAMLPGLWRQMERIEPFAV